MSLIKLLENNLLTETEIARLNESFQEELHGIIDAQIKQPVSQTITQLIKTVAPSLKTWAIEASHILQKNGGVGMELLQKIINNPEAITKQLITKTTNGICGAIK
jgi:hypothetical protein